MLALVLSACSRFEATVIGGGSATVVVSDDDAGTTATWTVDGLDDDELDEAFADGHHPGEVLDALRVAALEPGHRLFYAFLCEQTAGTTYVTSAGTPTDVFVRVDGLQEKVFCGGNLVFGPHRHYQPDVGQHVVRLRRAGLLWVRPAA